LPHHLKPPKTYFFVISLVIACLLSLPLSFTLKNVLKKLAYFRSINTLQALKQSNLDLKEKILELEKIISHQEDLIQENKRLKKMLSLKEEYPSTLIPASIISKNPWSTSKEILIDRGKSDGVTEGSLIIDHQINLVGKVERVKNKESWVKLVSDPNFKVVVNCAELNTLLVGALFEGAKLLYVPYYFPINHKDKVILPGSFKAGFDILVGEVSFIKKSRSSLTQNIFVKPYVDLNNLREVFIVKER